MAARKVRLLLTVLLACTSTVLAQSGPCASEDAIYLPREGSCLVTMNNAKDWIQAQKTCEQNLGVLYRLTDKLELHASPRLGQCLAAMPRGNRLNNDFWIGVASYWSRHWFWINQTLLNPIRYVTMDTQAFESSSPFTMCSNYLSVDYCVSVCSDDAAAFTVLEAQMSYPCCFCSSRLNRALVNVSANAYFQQPDPNAYYVAASREGESITISLSSDETFSETETLCAVVDTETSQSRKLLSKTCFSEFPFICNLGKKTAEQCDTLNCQGTQCRFRIRDDCVQRDSSPMTWFRARRQCQEAGGDLWMLGKLDDMYQVSRYLVSRTFYWIGATDHEWFFTPDSNIFGSETPDYEIVRCGHLFLEGSGNPTLTPYWKWADTQCDQQKSYICQYKQTTYTTTNTDKEVICPWRIPGIDFPIETTTNPGSITGTPTNSPGNFTNNTGTPTNNTGTPTNNTSISTNNPGTFTNHPGNSTSNSAVTTNGSGIINTSFPPVARALVSTSSYPIIPIIAACIAALCIALCAAFMIGYSRRRKWLWKKWQMTGDLLWPVWASTPTYLAPDYTSDRGLDSFSTGHDSGSVFASPALAFPDKSQSYLLRWDSKNGSQDHNPRERLQGQTSFNSDGSRHTGASPPMDGEDSGGSPFGENVTDESRMLSAYSPFSPRSREYMTLAAHMTIPEESESVGNSLRRKPEVALVTNDLDLNFTVNHAFARSPQGSDRSSEKDMDDLDNLPLTSTVEIPTRTLEQSLRL